MARYLLNVFLAAWIVTVAVSTQSRRNMEQKKNTRREYTSAPVQCMDMNYVDFNLWCNGIRDCPDGSDEWYCQYKCLDMTYTYVDSSQWCDGIRDCPDGSDESSCEATTYYPPASGYTDSPLAPATTYYPTASGLVYCWDKLSHVDSSKVCDGKMDCEDGTDEINCAGELKYQCNNLMENVNSIQMCDGINDCTDGSDEWLCAEYTDSPLGPATTYYPPASGYTDYPTVPGTGSTTFENCQCTCSSPEMYWKKSIEARGLKTLTKGKQNPENVQPKPQFVKKSHKTKNYLEHLLRAMKAKQLRKEQK